MKILSIETSADETAVSLIQVTGEFPTAQYEILGNALSSQVDMHAQYGGIFPSLAKREHAGKIVPLLIKTLEEAGMLEEKSLPEPLSNEHALEEILAEREPELLSALQKFLRTYEAPEIDMIAVTTGPGLAPALWVGVNFAKALATAWNVKVAPVNHMEGHILASIFDVVEDDELVPIEFPAVALLISGGHTELVKMDRWGSYEKIGQTRDDAVGEAFDKVARLLGFAYPGGKEIDERAALARKQNLPPFTDKPLPRPMLHSGDLDFSFSGLKTAVRYAVQDKDLSDNDKTAIARDFMDAVIEVLLKKVSAALETTGAKTLIVGGGVSASRGIRTALNTTLLETHPNVEVYFPAPGLSTDNSIMIALAGHAKAGTATPAGSVSNLRADANKSL